MRNFIIILFCACCCLASNLEQRITDFRTACISATSIDTSKTFTPQKPVTINSGKATAGELEVLAVIEANEPQSEFEVLADEMISILNDLEKEGISDRGQTIIGRLLIENLCIFAERIDDANAVN